MKNNIELGNREYVISPQNTKCVLYKMIEGTYLIAENDQWIPGEYGSREAAIKATNYSNVVLIELQNKLNNNPITLKDLDMILNG